MRGSAEQPKKEEKKEEKKPEPQPEPTPSNQEEPPMDFDDDIPFAPIGLQYGRNFLHCF
ncbi:single-stranded DNA-binding protein [Escherichia coli]|nr:single-stranded DNA-binding protein [Escherichia coli]